MEYTIWASNDYPYTPDDIFAKTNDRREAKDLLSDAKAQYNWAHVQDGEDETLYNYI